MTTAAILVLAACGGGDDDSGSGAGGSGGSTTDSGNASHQGIVCGDTMCEAACCTDGSPKATCTDDVGTCLQNGQGHYMTCDGPEDCPQGTVCCIGVGSETICVSQDQCAPGGQQQIACHDAGDCPDGESCQPAEHASDGFVPTLLGCK